MIKYNWKYIEKWIDDLDILNPFEVYQGLSGAYGDVWDRIFYTVANQDEIPMRVYPSGGIKFKIPSRYHHQA